ncbi:MAG: TylF/MycF/NovP-related O-methyltransferase [Smithella sp.]
MKKPEEGKTNDYNQPLNRETPDEEIIDNGAIGNCNIVYKPSLIGRIARWLIPMLQRVMPFRLFKMVYDFLYVFYTKAIHISYYRCVLMAKLFGDMNDAIRASLTFKLLPYTMGGPKALENAFAITALVEQKKIEGALVECGVAKGGTAAMMALTNREIGSVVRQKWFFDSFEGLPEPTDDDYKNGKAGHFVRPLQKGDCLGTIEQVSKLFFELLGFPRNEVHLVKGWFQDTVPAHKDKIGQIAVLRLDGDWYESTKIPLENFYDEINTGGYVIIDDYATCFGSRKATDEFRAARNITSILHPDGRGGAWFEK